MSDQAAVAAAEAAAFGGTDLDEVGARDTVQDLVVSVLDGPWWRAVGPTVTLATPRAGTRSSSARGGFGDNVGRRAVEIRLSNEQLTVSTAAHELAHAVSGVDHGHDEMFRAAYVDVVALLAGAEAAAHLAAAFVEFGVPAGERGWPLPWRAEGRTFRLVP